jgi:nicotinic acid phosphoribosyltransferase
VNILIRKLIFNEAEIHLILWNDKPCFFVSELSKALDSVNKEDISVFLRYGGSANKGVDYDVVGGAEARDLRSYLENSGIKKRFAHTMIIYFEGLRKYFNYRKTVESKDFINYLAKCKVSLEADSVASVSAIEAAPPAPIVAPVAAPLPDTKPVVSKKRETALSPDNTNSSYSDFLKHISFMEEFVDTFNKLKIPPDKSVAFTKSMAKFLEDNGIQTSDFLKEIKKWIV